MSKNDIQSKSQKHNSSKRNEKQNLREILYADKVDKQDLDHEKEEGQVEDVKIEYKPKSMSDRMINVFESHNKPVD